jgi:hypothetical protein
VAQRQFVASTTRVGNIVPVPRGRNAFWAPDTIKIDQNPSHRLRCNGKKMRAVRTRLSRQKLRGLP